MAPGIAHITRWEGAPHGQAGVACVNCHGGNAAAPGAAVAHQGVLAADVLESPIHPVSVPATCGACHAPQLRAFRMSAHSRALQQGIGYGPVCTTCHGSADAVRVVPAAVATTCNRCHQPDGVAPEGDRPARARAFLDALQGVRANLDAATRLEAARPFTPAQQVRVETLRRQAEASLEQLEGRVHAFTGFDAGVAGVAGARTRVTALLDYVISAPLQ